MLYTKINVVYKYRILTLEMRVMGPSKKIGSILLAAPGLITIAYGLYSIVLAFLGDPYSEARALFLAISGAGYGFYSVLLGFRKNPMETFYGAMSALIDGFSVIISLPHTNIRISDLLSVEGRPLILVIVPSLVLSLLLISLLRRGYYG